MTVDEDDVFHMGMDTRYDGCKFRSRVEARWAVFFNVINIDWRYEPEGFDLPDGSAYLPDFYFPNVSARTTEDNGLWCEIKGRDIDGADSWEQEPFPTVSQLVEKTKTPAAVLTGEIENQNQHEVNYHGIADNGEVNAGVDWPMLFMMCEECSRVKFEFREGNYMSCEVCGGYCHPKHDRLQQAAMKAGEARFEHGETPDV
jgi:hypothetical protein